MSHQQQQHLELLSPAQVYKLIRQLLDENRHKQIIPLTLHSYVVDWIDFLCCQRHQLHPYPSVFKFLFTRFVTVYAQKCIPLSIFGGYIEDISLLSFLNSIRLKHLLASTIPITPGEEPTLDNIIPLITQTMIDFIAKYNVNPTLEQNSNFGKILHSIWHDRAPMYILEKKIPGK